MLDEYTKENLVLEFYAWNDTRFPINYQRTCVDKTYFLLFIIAMKNTKQVKTFVKFIGYLRIMCEIRLRLLICFIFNVLIIILLSYYHTFNILNVLSHYPRSLIWLPLVIWYCHSSYLGYWNCIAFIDYMLNIYTYKQTKFKILLWKEHNWN